MHTALHVQVRAGKKPDSCEVLFSARPPAHFREALKAAGFRWHQRDQLWWGKLAKLPAIIDAQCDHGLTVPAHDDCEMRDPGEDAADRWCESQGGAW